MMASILNQRFPIVTLDNGLTVVNYGSNHSYKFVTGEVLSACTDDVCRDTSLISNHSGVAQVLIDNAGSILRVSIPKNNIDNWHSYICEKYSEYKNCKMWLDVFIDYQVSDKIQDDLLAIAEMDIIEVILVPYPLMNAWSYETKIQKEVAKNMVDGVEQFYNNWEFALLKMRTCKLQDRVTKLIYSDRFCGSKESSKLDYNFHKSSSNLVNEL